MVDRLLDRWPTLILWWIAVGCSIYVAASLR
jgi:hypothetical protein